MQTGIPYLWLTRFQLGAAIALPSLSGLGLMLPAAASEPLRQPTLQIATWALPEPDEAALNGAATFTGKPQLVDKAAVGPNPTFSSPGSPFLPHSTAPGPVASEQTANPALMPTAAQASEAALESLTASGEVRESTPVALADELTTNSITAQPRGVEGAQPDVLFSQVTPPAETDAEEPLAPSEDAEPDEVFSPLPETEADPEGEVPPALEDDSPPAVDDLEQDPEGADLEEDLPFDIEELEDPGGEAETPIPTLEEAAPIPPERVLENYPYLDPLPNPLLTPTQPEEVEIIGTQPITLEEAIELAYRNNPDLRVALLELEQSRAALREALADLYPSLSVNGTIQGQNTTDASSSVVPSPGGGLSFQTESTEELGVSTSAQVDLVYNLYSSGRRQAAIQAAEEQVRLSELEVERRQEELRLNAADEYYDLQSAIEAIRISQAFLEEAERNLRDTRLREEVGVGTRFDVLRAEVQVANARQDLVNAERSRQVAQRTLARRLNVPPSLTITTVPVEIAGTWPLSLEESIVLAFQKRAELEQQLIQRDLNEQLRRVELSALGPQVDLFASYSISDILTQEDSFSDNYQFGARVSWTLFEGGAAQARARQRELEIEIAERNYEEARNTIRLSVESAYFSLQSNLTNIDTARLAVEQAREALDLATLRFDAGVGTQLDILNAQSELTDAEVNLVQAVVGYNRSLSELRRAVSNLPEGYYLDLPY